MDKRLTDLLAEHRLPASFEVVIQDVYRPLAQRVAHWRGQQKPSLVLGVNGAQGTGKSTLAAFLSALLETEHAMTSAVVSIDDLYLTRAERRQLSETVHPLLQTRGVPGTHDVALGQRILRDLCEDGPTAIPRFNKAIDDRSPSDEWPTCHTAVDVIIFEGWCVGAIAQSDAALHAPINQLESHEDADAAWRTFVNQQLNDQYPDLFDRIDRMVMLRAPSLDQVIAWRTEQEHKLAAQAAASGAEASHVMDDAAIARFVAHYERVTRHLWETLPARADVTIDLCDDHSIDQVTYSEQ